MSKPAKTAEKPAAPRLDFKQAAREIMRDHPEATKRILFIDPETHERHGTLGARLQGRTMRLFREKLKDAFRKAKESKAPLADIIRLGPVSAVLVTAKRETPEEALFDLHRETGKLIVSRAADNIRYFMALFGTPYAAPTASGDAYAAIRYLRQPGADLDFLKRQSLIRATDFLRTGDPEKLSYPVIDKIIADRDFSKMKIEDLPDVCGIYVKGYTPSRADSEALVKEFAALKGKALDAAGLKQLANITKASGNKLAQALGRKVLAAAGVNIDVPAPEKKPIPQPAP